MSPPSTASPGRFSKPPRAVPAARRLRPRPQGASLPRHAVASHAHTASSPSTKQTPRSLRSSLSCYLLHSLCRNTALCPGPRRCFLNTHQKNLLCLLVRPEPKKCTAEVLLLHVVQWASGFITTPCTNGYSLYTIFYPFTVVSLEDGSFPQ